MMITLSHYRWPLLWMFLIWPALVILADKAHAQNPTYYATSIGLAVQSAATDIVCLNNTDANITTKIWRIGLSGFATATNVPVLIIKRSAANTGGTLATGNALPVAIAADSGDRAATAVPQAWTANPSVGTVIGTMAGIVWSIAAAASNPDTTGFLISNFSDANYNPIILRAAQAVCINFNATVLTGGTISTTLRWTEQRN